MTVNAASPLDFRFAPAHHGLMNVQGLVAAIPTNSIFNNGKAHQQVTTAVFAPLSWIDIKAIQLDVDAVGTAINSEQCDWNVTKIESTAGVSFGIISSKEECYGTIPVVMQDQIPLLIMRMLFSRMRIGSFPENAPNTFDLVGITGNPIVNDSTRQFTNGLSGNVQLIPSTILVGLSCFFYSGLSPSNSVPGTRR